MKNLILVAGLLAITMANVNAETITPPPPPCNPAACQKECYIPFLENGGKALTQPGPINALETIINTAKACIAQHKYSLCKPADCKLQ